MAKAQAKAVDDIWAKRAPDLPIKSPGELVTLASIVEKETGKADERPRVAGVFINRLQKHMKLQSDPTIVYGLVFGKGTLGHPITKAELDQATPYNTYIIDGLPPGPICNPGKAALEAVANPAAHARNSISSPTERAATLSRRRWTSISRTSRIGGKSSRTPRTSSRPTRRRPAPRRAAKHGALDPLDPRIFGAVALVRRAGSADERRRARRASSPSSARNCAFATRCWAPMARCRRRK